MQHKHDHEGEVKVTTDIVEEVKKAKEHFRKNKKFYIRAACGIGVAGITWAITRGVASQPISRDVIVTAGRDAIVSRKKIVMDNVSFISADRQGPPSWVVRCKETGDIFTSQNAAAADLGITKSNISRHLNGLQENAQGFHLERICLAA